MNKVTEVQIYPIKPKDGLIGFASVILDSKVYLGSIGIYRKLNSEEFRLTYPTKKVGDKNLNIFYPINRETGLAIEKAITQKAEEIFSQNLMNNVMKNNGHNSTFNTFQ
jgi:DNA-binding cell septation regulator SpoVG